ncbi:dTMP kinase [Ferviditalea candida]|uniref:Thymidylate kinase n=1 Tax=Ferviditalea candida TaxID=3108399 RepID=A0ABU5ZIP5_9BACL|nr:dTMP kinase [Paenibacillaceae bacterium T2]
MKGIFITFEGPDGAGKTTQLKKLAFALQEEGWSAVVTREPGGTMISDKIREILLSPDHVEMSDQAEVLLYAASRAQHVRELIAPSLNRGEIVLCDRFVDASIAYQAYGLGVEERVVRSVNEFATGGLVPDRTYMLDIPVEESRHRLLTRSGAELTPELDRIEQKELEYHRRVREGFLRIAQAEPHRVRLLDAAGSEEVLAGAILSDVKLLLERCL